MRALVQRVSSASVRIDGRTVGRIGAGLCVFVGVTHGDGQAEAARLADKVWRLRVLADESGSMNSSLSDLAATGAPAEVLVISQFTLYGDASRGRRPSWTAAARPEVAQPLIEVFTRTLSGSGATVATGRFGADMAVSLVNDGPVTILLELEPRRSKSTSDGPAARAVEVNEADDAIQPKAGRGAKKQGRPSSPLPG